MSESYAMTVHQVAARWACSDRHVYDLVSEGRLGHIRVGSLIRIRPADLAAYEESQWHAPVSPAQTTASCSEGGATTSDGGRTAGIDGFQRGRAMAGVPMRQIARFLGDSEAVVERVYAKNSPSYLRRAAAALAGLPAPVGTGNHRPKKPRESS